MSYSKREKHKILTKGLEIYKSEPSKLNYHYLAKQLGVSNAKIHYHFPEGNLMECVLGHALETQDSSVIVGMIGSNHPLVSDMSKAEKQKHFKAV